MPRSKSDKSNQMIEKIKAIDEVVKQLHPNFNFFGSQGFAEGYLKSCVLLAKHVDKNMVIDMSESNMLDNSILLIIDVQNDFTRGSFTVENAPNCVAAINYILNHNNFHHVFLTKDFHPPDHVSFWNVHPADVDGIKTRRITPDFKTHFPPHCVQSNNVQGDYITDIPLESKGNCKPRGGAKFHPDLLPSLVALKQSPKDSVFFKGFHPEFDSFGGVMYKNDDYTDTAHVAVYGRAHENCQREACSGAFQATELSSWDADPTDPIFYRTTPTQSLGKAIQDKKGISNNIPIYICGLALDFCVLDTALNLRKQNSLYKIYIVIDASYPAYVQGRHITPFWELVKKCARNNIKFATTMDLDVLRIEIPRNKIVIPDTLTDIFVETDIPLEGYKGGSKSKKTKKAAKTAKSAKKATKTRKPSAYNVFVGKELRAGKTMAEAAKLWKASK